MKTTLYIIVRVEVETSFAGIEDTIDELQTYTDYRINSTENVHVLQTELMECTTQY